jgi:hypothetical protein
MLVRLRSHCVRFLRVRVWVENYRVRTMLGRRASLGASSLAPAFQAGKAPLPRFITMSSSLSEVLRWQTLDYLHQSWPVSLVITDSGVASSECSLNQQ